MKRFWVVGVCLACLGGVAVADEAQMDKFVERPGAMEFSGQMIARPIQVSDWRVRGLSGAEALAHHQAAANLMADYRLKETNGYVPQTDEYVFYVPEGMTENELAASLMKTGQFQYVHPNWIVYPVGCPDDAQFGSQWHHAADRMNSCAGWDIETGTPDIGVGICDTGVRTTHEDLQLHRNEGYNAVDQLWESQGGQIGPVHSHGTQTTGCAAGNGNNGIGISGTGWNLSHRMLRVSNDSSGNSSLDVLMHAARTAIEAGDRVASVSYTGVNSDTIRTTATYIKSINGLLFYAADNYGQNHNWGDRDADDVVVVGATDQSDGLAWFSSYGRSVDLVAPGVGIFTTTSSSDSAYTTNDGTSFATPLTAGLAGVVWSYNPAMTPDEVEAAIKAGCDDLGASGVDDTFGYGRIDVEGALQAAIPPGGMNVQGDNFNSEGPVGGPFTPDHIDYVIVNYDPTPTDYSVSVSENWLDLSTSGGTIPGDSSVTVTVSINSLADSFGNGAYNGVITFTNDTTGQGDATRDVSLQVGVPVLIYEWTLDTDPGWSTESLWAYGQPTGNGGEYGNPDPTSGHTGPNVYGYNLNGDYSNSMPEYDLTTDAIDCSTLTRTSLKFWRYLNVETSSYDHAYVRVSTDGTTWTDAWSNSGEITDNAWGQVEYDISAVADGQPTVYVRWTMGTTDTSWRFSGWNIDDVEIWGLAQNDCPPDWNGDTVLDSQDFIAFLNDFTAGNADYDGDTTTDSQDFIAFLNDFVAGC